MTIKSVEGPTGFTPRGQGRPAPLWRKRPSSNAQYVVFGPAPDGFQAFVIREVLVHIQLELLRARPNETIGLVAGRACVDREGPYTLVCAAEVARSGEYTGTPGHVEISAEGMAAVRGRLELAHPALEILGWYHTHPDCEPRFSYTDTLEQATWPSPGNVGLVGGGHPSYLPFYLYRGPGAEFIDADPAAHGAMEKAKAEARARLNTIKLSATPGPAEPSMVLSLVSGPEPIAAEAVGVVQTEDTLQGPAGKATPGALRLDPTSAPTLDGEVNSSCERLSTLEVRSCSDSNGDLKEDLPTSAHKTASGFYGKRGSIATPGSQLSGAMRRSDWVGPLVGLTLALALGCLTGLGLLSLHFNDTQVRLLTQLIALEERLSSEQTAQPTALPLQDTQLSMSLLTPTAPAAPAAPTASSAPTISSSGSEDAVATPPLSDRVPKVDANPY